MIHAVRFDRPDGLGHFLGLDRAALPVESFTLDALVHVMWCAQKIERR